MNVSYIKSLFKPIVRWMGETGYGKLLVDRCVADTTEFSQIEGSIVGDAVKLLALSPNRFRSDLEILNDTGKFQIFEMPEYWQYAILNLYYGQDIARRDLFLRNFLGAFSTILGIQGIVGAAVWYRQDLPWGNVAQSIGIPYVILHKECFKPEPTQMRKTVEKALSYGQFRGEHIVVHNSPMREALINSGYVQPEKISALGCMRMDKFVRRTALKSVSTSQCPLATFFSFTLGVGLDDLGVDPFPRNSEDGWKDLFDKSHIAFAKLACDTPNSNFIIKTKWSGQWTDRIKRILEDAGLPLENIPNLNLGTGSDAHDLILKSNVIVTFGSTTMLEAGLAGKPVVVPDFSEAQHPVFSDRVKLRDDYDIFDIASTPEFFMQKIAEHLENPKVDAQYETKRKHLFEQWVSAIDGCSTQRYCDLLRSVTNDVGIMRS